MDALFQRTDQRFSARGRDYYKRQVHCSDLFLRQLATFPSCFPRAINTHLPPGIGNAPPRTGWFVRRTLIARLLIVQQESNVNTPITLIYSNRGRSLPIEDNLCNGAFMRGVYVAIRARGPQRESTIVSIRRRSWPIKSTKTARSTDTERNSFRVYNRAINSPGPVQRKGRGYTLRKEPSFRF